MLALTSVLAWSAGRMSSRPHGNWDVPSADVAASSHPLRSVGERSDDNARAHHAGLVKEIVAANTKEVLPYLFASRLAVASGLEARRRCCQATCMALVLVAYDAYVS